MQKKGRGRPRTTTPETKQLIALGEELVKWASEKTDELRCRYSQWYSVIKGMTHNQWDLMVKCEDFRLYYEKAQTLLGQKYIDGSVKEGIAHRFMRIYCPEVKKREDKDYQEKLDKDLEYKKSLIEYELKLKSDSTSSVTQEILDQFNATMHQLSELQSKRKIADKIKIKE